MGRAAVERKKAALREARARSGRCKNSMLHGKATRGGLCESCWNLAEQLRKERTGRSPKLLRDNDDHRRKRARRAALRPIMYGEDRIARARREAREEIWAENPYGHGYSSYGGAYHNSRSEFDRRVQERFVAKLIAMGIAVEGA